MFHSFAFLVLLAAGTGDISGSVVVTKDGSPKTDHSGVVVYLERVKVPAGEKPTHVPMRQKDKAFVPHMLVVAKGTVVDFPNNDPTFHNVFSISTPAKFDLGLYDGEEFKSVTMDRTGVVNVYCNIHPDMAAVIKVVDNKHFAVTAADGKFKIAGIPVGSYPIVAWHPGGEEWTGTVKVSKDGSTAVPAITLGDKLEVKRHMRKDGTPYPHYQ